MSAAPRPFTAVVAADDADGIGLDGGLPWHLPPDLRRFRELTTGAGRNAVIMGRATWASLPERFRPLPGRVNVVLSRDPGFEPPPPARVARSLADALGLAADADETFVIGGGQVYAEALAHPRCAAVALTRVRGDFGCDVALSPLPDAFVRVTAGPELAHGDLRYRFERWERRR